MVIDQTSKNNHQNRCSKPQENNKQKRLSKKIKWADKWTKGKRKKDNL